MICIMKKNFSIQNHQVIIKKSKGEISNTNLWKNLIPKEYINTQKVINAQNLNSKSEPPAPKVIMVDNKIRTDVSLLYLVTGASLTPKKRIPRKKSNMKSPEMFPPRKDLIPNQYHNRLSTEKIKISHHI